MPRKRPRKATPQHLENAATAYLARRPAPEAHLRALLMRRVRRSADVHGTDPEEGAAAVEAVIAKCRRYGWLDDSAYAEHRARTLLARGTPPRVIRARLKHNGVGDADLAAAEAVIAEAGDPDLEAAWAYARRRGLGPYRAPERRAERRRKDLAAMGRAGFSPPVARAVIDADTEGSPGG